MNCHICEREIPPARLLAMPATRLCLPCISREDGKPWALDSEERDAD